LTLKNVKRTKDTKQTAAASDIELRQTTAGDKEDEEDAGADAQAQQAWRDRHAHAYDPQELMETRLLKLS
jgi:hypothetical protein